MAIKEEIFNGFSLEIDAKGTVVLCPECMYPLKFPMISPSGERMLPVCMKCYEERRDGIAIVIRGKAINDES